MSISQAETSYFQERVTFFSNCFTLYNYNLSGNGSYANNQIKSEEASGTLHFASTLSMERVFQWPLRLFTEPSTTLDKTVILIEKVCEKIFTETSALGSILTESKEKFKITVSRYNFLCHLIHGVFRGVKIMNNTYQNHYFTSDPNHPGLEKLFQLAKKLENRADTIKEEYNKVGLSLKKLDQNDVNQFLCDEVTYHDNLYALSKYGTTENAKYRNLQVKAIQDTERLLSTSFWDPSNWTGELTSLDKTAPIIKKVCERTANECIPLLQILSTTPKIDNSMKMMFIQDLRSKLELALPGVIRMNNVYRKHYFRKRLPEHKGLNDLKECANSLGWAESQLYLLNLRFPEKQ